MVLDRIIALLLLALAGLFYSLTYLYPPETMSFPRFLLVIFGILSIFLFLSPGKKEGYKYEELFASEKDHHLLGRPDVRIPDPPPRFFRLLVSFCVSLCLEI